MRWLMYSFLFSIAALLAAAAGMVIHVLVQHRRQRQQQNLHSTAESPEFEGSVQEADAK